MIKEDNKRIEKSLSRNPASEVINVAGKHSSYNFLIAAILFTERLSEPLFLLG